MAYKFTALAVTTLFLTTSANAAYFEATINVGQTLAVTPSDTSEVSQYSGTIDLSSLAGIPDLFSGAYYINWGGVQFDFNQQAFISGTTEDLVFAGSSSYLQSAQSEQIIEGGEQYNYVVDLYHEDYYYDQRASAGAAVEINPDPYFYGPQYTYFGGNTTYELNHEEFIVPPGTTGTIERHTFYDYTDQLSDQTSVWFDYYGYGYGWDGVLDYTATATNGFLDLDSIYVYLDYQPAIVPVPAAVWLFGSGLIGLVGVARRKKA